MNININMNMNINMKPKIKFALLPAIFTMLIFTILFLNPVFGKNAFAGAGNAVCKGIYASNPIIYGLYLKAENRPINKSDIKTYIKIVDPARYMHDRHNPFLWSELYSKDKTKLKKMMDFINSVRYFKENIKAEISKYNFERHGFYLLYNRSDRIIKNGMKIDRGINFIKIKNSDIYYLFHNLTIVHKNAGDFNFFNMPEKNAEKFINKRTGIFGHIERRVFLEYYFVPLKAGNNILTVRAVCVKVYNNKHKSLLIGTIK